MTKINFMQNFLNLCRIWSWSTNSWDVLPNLQVLEGYYGL